MAANEEGVWEPLDDGSWVVPKIRAFHSCWLNQQHSQTQRVKKLLETARLMEECQDLNIVVHDVVVFLSAFSLSMPTFSILFNHARQFFLILFLTSVQMGEKKNWIQHIRDTFLWCQIQWMLILWWTWSFRRSRSFYIYSQLTDFGSLILKVEGFWVDRILASRRSRIIFWLIAFQINLAIQVLFSAFFK